MIRRALTACIAMLMAADLGSAGERMIVKTDWAGFQDQVAQRKLKNRNVRISLASGDQIKARLMRVEESGIVVSSNRATKQWVSNKGEATVPRDAISSVRFDGRVGRGGQIAGLVGLGTGAVVTGIWASGMGGTCEGGSCGAALFLIPLAAVGGWLIGRATAQPAPLFDIQR